MVGYQAYDVASRNSDGDTFVSYTSKDGNIVVYLDDQGDKLQLKDSDEEYDLQCK